MKSLLAPILGALILSPALLVAEAPVVGGMLNLSCVAALVAVGHADLAGTFSFINEKDAPAAFADFVAHNKAALKKYMDKLNRDFKAAGGISVWDHEAVMKIIEVYSSPLGETLEKPGAVIGKRLTELSVAPTLTLEEITAKNRGK